MSFLFSLADTLKSVNIEIDPELKLKKFKEEIQR